MPKLAGLPSATGLNAADLLLISQSGLSKSAQASLLLEGNLKLYGAIADSLTDNTVAINNWITVCQQIGYGIVPAGAGAYLTSGNHQITKPFNIIGYGGGAYNTSFPRFLLSANATSLFTWNGLTTGGPTLNGFSVSGIIFHGNGKTCSDALVVFQGVTRAEIRSCGFHNVTGAALRLRQFWDSVFRDCMWRRVDATAATAVIVVDSRYNSDNNQNVNNLVIDRGHLEANNGIVLYSAPDSNFDLLKIINTKFESGIVNSIPVPLINLKQASNVIIAGNNFDLITAERGYSSIFELGDTATGASCSSYNIHNNYFVSLSATTVYANIRVGRGDFFNNFLTNINVTPSFICTAPGANRLEQPRNNSIQSDGSQAIARAGLAQNGFVSVNNLLSTALFSQDTTSLSLSQAVVSLQAPGSIFCSFPVPSWSGLPGSLRLGIRCKSLAGTGTIVLTVNTTDFPAQVVPTGAFSVIWFDIPNSFLSVMGQNAADRFRIKVGTANTDTITVDGVYFQQVPWHYTATFTYDPPSLAANTATTTTFAMAGVTLGDSVEVYPPYDLQGILHSACVSSTGNIRLSLYNPPAAATLDLASGSWTFRVTKK